MRSLKVGVRGGLAFLVLLVVSWPLAAQPPTDVFISEYIEGSSFNKAIEIFNGTGATVDLAAGGYELSFFFNGSTSAGTTIALTGSVANGDVYVVADDGAVAAVLAEADQTPSSPFFNGDDAVVLFKGSAVVDAIGQVGVDPGSEWSGGGIGTQNETIRRKIAVCQGDTVETDAFDPSVDWDGFAQDTFDGLGSHVQNCTGPIVPILDILLTEILVTPTAGEFIEIYNPTGLAIDLSDVYLTDATFAGGGTYYYNIVTGTNAGGGGFGDFHARFPDGAMIGPDEYQTVAIAGSDDFFTEYGTNPTYELYEDGASADGVPDMREALPGAINNQGGLTNSGEIVILYTWDGDSDLVQDIDYAVWGDKDEAVDKTGVSIDGPDADATTSTYLADTAVAAQDVVATGAHVSGNSYHRIDVTEGTEIQSGGNGVTGSDETSEDLSNTWQELAPTPGAGPPPPPASAWIVNEVHADPASDSPGDANADGIRDFSDDEFVEIVNTDASAIDISGWTLADGASTRHTFPAGTVVPAGCSIVVFGGGTPTGTFGNSLVQTASSGALGLNNSGDSVTLNDGGSDVTAASYGSEGGDNQSVTLDPDLSLPPFVKHSEATGSGGALYSPGTRIDGSQFSGCAPLPDQWVINEIHADPDGTLGDANGDGTTSTSADEFVEIVNTTGVAVDISDWTLSDGFTVRHTFPAGTVVLDQCSIVVFGGGSPSGGFGNALVQVASSGSLGLNNGGDTVTLNDGGSDQTQSTYGSDGGDNQSLTLDPDLSVPPYVKHSVATGSLGALYSPGTRIDGTQFSGCPVFAEIFEIQGNGLASPLDGSLVMTENNVVTAVAPNGFFMQTPAARSDFDVDTSDGIFVFTGSAPTVVQGNLVDVTGIVNEFFEFTEITDATYTVVGSSMLPGYITFDATVPSPDPTAPSCAIEFECYEGMLIEVPLGAVTGPNQRFNPDPVAEVHITSAPMRTFREPGIEYPGLPGLPVWDGNPEVFELDPDKLGLPNQIIPAGSTFSAIGALGYEFGGYELWPSQLTVTPAEIPNAVRSREEGEFTVGSLNLFRLFDDVDDPKTPNALGEVIRDDTVVSTVEYQRRLVKFAAAILDVLDAPDILAVQEAEKVEVLADLAAVITAADASVVYTAHLLEGNDVGTIDVGFLVRDTVQVDLPLTQIGATEILTYDGSLLHDRPPLLIEGRWIADGLPGSPVRVINVHMRSLGSIDSPTSGERVRQKRLEQAESLAGVVQGLQDVDPATPLIIVGDFNAFEFTDGYVDLVGHVKGDFDLSKELVCESNLCLDLVSPNLTDQVLDLAPEDRYSFIFRGNAQVLDHALTTEATDAYVRGFEFGRGNADAAFDLINDDGTLYDAALRSSDHDGFVLYLIGDGDQDGVVADRDFCPGTLIPELTPTLFQMTGAYRLLDGDTVFDVTIPPKFKGEVPSFTTQDTAGCSCNQIADELPLPRGVGEKYKRFGCPLWVMQTWSELVNVE